MAPPSYGDLGKNARDLFGKLYNYGNNKLEVRTKSANGVEFNLKGSSSHDTGKVDGSLETKKVFKDYGLTLKETWSTENKIKGELTVQDKLLEGLKLTFESSFYPYTGKKDAQVKTRYCFGKYFTADVDTELDFAGPNVLGSAVFAYNDLLLGGQAGFDTAKSALVKHGVTAGYATKDLEIFTAMKDANEFNATVHHAVDSNLKVGIDVGWKTGDAGTRFGVAMLYTLDALTSFRSKLNNAGLLGLALEHQLRPGAKMIVSSLVDVKNFAGGAHKIGFGLEFEPSS